MTDTTPRLNQLKLTPGVIDLGIGQPDFDLLPLAQMRQAAAQRLAADDTTLLNYGFAQGDGRFREALAAFLQPRYGTVVDPTMLQITAGASQALDFICTHFTRPGDTVFVEEPSYFLVLRIFADHGLNIVSLPVDADGLIPEAVAEALTQHRPVFLYTIPTFQNPTGVTLTPARRQALLVLAERHNFLIVADEVYQLLAYSDTLPPPMAAYVDNGRVLSVGSFSKILAPGLRLGWIQGAPARLAPLANAGMVDSGGGLSHFVSNLVTPLLTGDGQADYLALLRETYARRVRVLAQALTRHLGERLTFRTPGGGFFFWCDLGEGTDTAELLPIANRHRTGFQPGVRFSSRGGLQRYLRLSFAFYDKDEIETAVLRLATAVAEYDRHSS